MVNDSILQCGTIMTLISPGDCTLQCGMWLWNFRLCPDICRHGTFYPNPCMPF